LTLPVLSVSFLFFPAFFIAALAFRLPALAEENKTLARVDKYGAARLAVTGYSAAL
jgi:hypothetical protein